MTDINAIKANIASSPAFVLDELEIIQALTSLANLRELSGCKLLYSIKSLPLVTLLQFIKPYVDGFAVSSLFEARLADEVLAGQGSIHLTTPGIRSDEINELAKLCSHVSCNSVNQFEQVSRAANQQASVGIRLNPELAFADDDRYDPCRPHSKLGVDLDTLSHTLNHPKNVGEIQGLHFHTVYSARDYAPLVQTVAKLRSALGDALAGLEWLNLGGGYLYGQIEANGDFIDVVKALRREFNLDVYIEPGAAIVNKAGYLLATVLDCFGSDGKAVAVLDTSVNHHPQVFEYQRQPELHEHNDEGCFSGILAGNTCLAGDIFGEYRLNRPLQVGDRVVFKNVGAYSLVKANRFNGQNLPAVYWAKGGRVQQAKQYTYQDYRRQWLGEG